MTAIEILVTFVIVAIIVVSMYDGILDLKNKETVASYKLSLVTYKNLLTKDIQDDLIKIGLSSVSTTPLADNKGYQIRFVLKDGSVRVLEIVQVLGCDAVDEIEADEMCTKAGISLNQSDEFSISYGPEGNLTEYPLPDLGHNDIEYSGSSTTHRVYSLKINSVDISTANNVFSLHISLYHPDLGSKHSIDIVTPINYQGGIDSHEPPTVPTAHIRREDSNGEILPNSDSWRRDTLWFGDFTSASSNGIKKIEYSNECSGKVDGNLSLNGELYRETQGLKYCIRAVDNRDWVSDWSIPYFLKIDKSPPICSSDGGSETWTNGSRKLIGKCTDSHSGCVGNISKNYNSEGNFVNQSPGTVEDKAGNKTVCPANQTVRIDRTPPTIDVRYLSNFYLPTSGRVHPRVVQTQINDNLSGVVKASYYVPYTINGTWNMNYSSLPGATENFAMDKTSNSNFSISTQDTAGNSASISNNYYALSRTPIVIY